MEIGAESNKHIIEFEKKIKIERTYSKSSGIGFKFVFRTPRQQLTKLAKTKSSHVN